MLADTRRLHPGFQRLSPLVDDGLFFMLSLSVLAADKEDAMSKFFTYEERLDLQKFLKDSLLFKEISRRLGTIIRCNVNYITKTIKLWPHDMGTC